MKSIILLSAVLLFASTVFANDEKYISAMKNNIQSIYDAKSIEEFQQSINKFERIAAAEKQRWEPQYYIAFGYIMMANVESEGQAKRDAYLDQAMAAITRAMEINPNESEVIAMEGFTHMIRLTVDPQSRGQQYSALAFQSFQKAVNLNPENPRALALLAQMQYGTAQFFGSPTDEACGTMKKALEKFDNFTSENPLTPQWGRAMTDGLKAKCEGEIEGK